MKRIMVIMLCQIFIIGCISNEGINGKWRNSEDNNYYLILNNGIYEEGSSKYGKDFKGTYKIINNNINFVQTHIHSDFLYQFYYPFVKIKKEWILINEFDEYFKKFCYNEYYPVIGVREEMYEKAYKDDISAWKSLFKHKMNKENSDNVIFSLIENKLNLSYSYIDVFGDNEIVSIDYIRK